MDLHAMSNSETLCFVF